MKKSMIKSYIYIVALIIFSSVLYSKKDKNLLKDSIIIKQTPYTIEEINTLKELYDAGNYQALETLVAIYKNKNQLYNIRIKTLNILSTIDNPIIQEALEESLTNTMFVESELFYNSLNALLEYNDINSTETFIKALSKSEEKIMELREQIIDKIGENGSEDKILTLIDLYEISQSNHSRMNELLSMTLGNIDDDRGIPILIKIANDKSINIRIRNKAVEILARKNAPELVDYFIELLGDPETNEEMTNFINNAMGDIHNDRMIMVLLESFQTGKNRYFANLHSIMNTLENYNNPKIKPAFIEIALSDNFPRLTRVKAINSLKNFNDVEVLNQIIPILDNSENYEFYFDILNLAKDLNANNAYINDIRKAGFNAMNKQND